VPALWSMPVRLNRVNPVRGVPARQEGEELWCRAIVDEGVGHAGYPVGRRPGGAARGGDTADVVAVAYR
jgi:hypothetical protein